MIKDWSVEENKELLDFMKEGQEKGIPVRLVCEQFVEKHPELSREQVRSHYYQLINDPDNKKTYKQGSWTREEEDFLFKTIKEKKHEMNKLEIFNYIGEKLKRNPRAIASHYYFIKKQKEKEKERELDNFIYNMSNLDISKIDSLLNKLKEIHQYDNKDKKILNLEIKNETFANQIKELNKNLAKANEIINAYKIKFKNLREPSL